MTGDSIKVTMLGKENVGKTAIVSRLAEDRFSGRSVTVGAAVSELHIEHLVCQVWDTAGQERFACMLPMYYRDSDLVILVYDITSRESFDKVCAMALSVQEEVGEQCKFLIVGNKTDLDNQRQVFSPQIEKFRTDHQEFRFTEFSAKQGPKTAITDIIKDIFKDRNVEASDGAETRHKYSYHDHARESTCC